MTKIKRIQNGDGITFTIYKDGELINFRLTLVKRENSWSKYHEFIFISDCKKYYTNSPYNGGNTGFGVNDYSISGFLHTTDDDSFKEYTIITEDIDTINKIVDEEQNNEKKKFEEFCKKQYAKVKRINALPKTFKTPYTNLTFIRDEAEFEPTQSHSIQGGKVYLKAKGDKYQYRMEYYITTVGRKRIKDFTYEYGEALANGNGEITKREMNKAFDTLLSQSRLISQMIDEA